MPPKKKVRQTSPKQSLSPHNLRARKVANTAHEDTDSSRWRSEQSTKGVGGHVAQLKKAGEIVMAPARQWKRANAVDISDSEVNPMAPSQQLKKGKKKADSDSLPRPVEVNDSQSNTRHQHPFLHMASHDDRFGFKSSSTDKQDPRMVTQSIGRISRKAVGESLERDMKERSSRDLDERDELDSENDADMQDHNDQPSEEENDLSHDTQEVPVDHMASPSNEDRDTHIDLDWGNFDSQVSDDDPTKCEGTDTFDHAHSLLRNTVWLAQSLVIGSCRPSLERAQTSSVYLNHGCAPRRAPSGKAALTHVWPERPPAHLSVTHSRSPQHLPHASSSRKWSPCRRSPTRSTASSSHKLPPSHGRSSLQSLPKHSAQPDRTPSPAPSSSRSCSHSASPIQRSKSQDDGQHVNQQGNPAKLGFYPASWQAFLQDAKLEMWLRAVLSHPVPVHQDVVLLAQEVLDTVLWTYHTKELKLDNGYFPEYKTLMLRLLCDDLFTFRTELKKIVISIMKQLYGIFSKGNSMHKEGVSEAVAKLLKTSEYLRVPDSSEVKYTNFVSQVLKEACLGFHYGNSRKALKVTDEFQHEIPVNGLILVAAVMKGVLSSFCDSSTDKVPDLTADTCRLDFNSLQKSVDKLMDIPECRAELKEMLRDWAKEGMIGELHNNSDSTAGSEDINIII
ncbi:hypothetical protein F4604DRAFT_1934744 [Suillus subluteus]|nr:hypothetical protein F4604DRAFT_1934744 [Suillus subluteus]